MLHSDVIFARFDNTSHANEMMASAVSNHNDDDAHGSMEVDLHFGTDQSIENVNQAFNNPMFDATSNIRDKLRDEIVSKDIDEGSGNGNNDRSGVGEAKV